MKNLLTALKKLGKKMTGNDVTGSNLVTVIDNIAEGYTGGGGSSGGGVENFDVNIYSSFDPSTMKSTISFDKTYEEMYAAFTEGKNIRGFYGNYICYLVENPDVTKHIYFRTGTGDSVIDLILNQDGSTFNANYSLQIQQ